LGNKGGAYGFEKRQKELKRQKKKKEKAERKLRKGSETEDGSSESGLVSEAPEASVVEGEAEPVAQTPAAATTKPDSKPAG
jgi:hypothetical protein